MFSETLIHKNDEAWDDEKHDVDVHIDLGKMEWMW